MAQKKKAKKRITKRKSSTRRATTSSGKPTARRAGTAAARSKASGTRSPVDNRSLDKVREILFGRERRTHEERVERIDKRFGTLRERIDQLDARMSETDAKRRSDLKALSKRVTALSQYVDEKVSGAQRRLAKASAGLRELLRDSSKQVRSSLDAKQREAVREIRRDLDELRRTLVDRKVLSSLLGDFASRLDGRRTSRR